MSGQRYSAPYTALLNAEGGRVYLDTSRPRVCIRGPEDRSNQDLGYAWLADEEVFPFFELRAAAVDLRGCPGGYDHGETVRRCGAMLDTLIDGGVRHAVLSAFGCGAFRNPAERVAAAFREALLAPAQPAARPPAADAQVLASSLARYQNYARLADRGLDVQRLQADMAAEGLDGAFLADRRLLVPAPRWADHTRWLSRPADRPAVGAVGSMLGGAAAPPAAPGSEEAAARDASAGAIPMTDAGRCRAAYFDLEAFAIFNAGYGPDNFRPFADAFAEWPPADAGAACRLG